MGKHKNLILIDNVANMFMLPNIINESNKVDTEKITAFVKDFTESKLEPYIISEEIPEKSYENNIKVLVGLNIEEELMNLKTDTVLLIYSRYSQDYSTVVFLFETISKKFENLSFAKIEGNRNAIPQLFKSETYPLAFYIKPGYKPQNITIDLEEPKNTLNEIYKYYRSSMDL